MRPFVAIRNPCADRGYDGAPIANGTTTMRSISLLAGLLMLASAPVMAVQVAPAHDAVVAPTRQKAPPHARVFITFPKDGATLEQKSVVVKFGAAHIGVAPAGEAKPGTGHHHLLIDVDELPPLDQPIPNDNSHRHYGKGQTEDTIELMPGTHTLQLDFGDAAHMQFDPPLVSKKITIHVK